TFDLANHAVGRLNGGSYGQLQVDIELVVVLSWNVLGAQDVQRNECDGHAERCGPQEHGEPAHLQGHPNETVIGPLEVRESAFPGASGRGPGTAAANVFECF